MCRILEKLSQSELETSDNEGEIENPNTLLLPVNKDITLKIEFHPCYTYYFLNNILIGEICGHFHLKYITYPELLQIAKQKYGDILFHLLLPLSAIREQEKEAAFDEITQRLKQIPIFQEQPDYISKCLLSGLLILNSDIQEIPEIGTICTSNHSYRNALVYDDDVKLEIKDLNALYQNYRCKQNNSCYVIPFKVIRNKLKNRSNGIFQKAGKYFIRNKKRICSKRFGNLSL